MDLQAAQAPIAPVAIDGVEIDLKEPAPKSLIDENIFSAAVTAADLALQTADPFKKQLIAKSEKVLSEHFAQFSKLWLKLNSIKDITAKHVRNREAKHFPSWLGKPPRPQVDDQSLAEIAEIHHNAVQQMFDSVIESHNRRITHLQESLKNLPRSLLEDLAKIFVEHSLDPQGPDATLAYSDAIQAFKAQEAVFVIKHNKKVASQQAAAKRKADKIEKAKVSALAKPEVPIGKLVHNAVQVAVNKALKSQPVAKSPKAKPGAPNRNGKGLQSKKRKPSPTPSNSKDQPAKKKKKVGQKNKTGRNKIPKKARV